MVTSSRRRPGSPIELRAELPLLIQASAGAYGDGVSEIHQSDQSDSPAIRSAHFATPDGLRENRLEVSPFDDLAVAKL